MEDYNITINDVHTDNGDVCFNIFAPSVTTGDPEAFARKLVNQIGCYWVDPGDPYWDIPTTVQIQPG